MNLNVQDETPTPSMAVDPAPSMSADPAASMSADPALAASMSADRAPSMSADRAPSIRVEPKPLSSFDSPLEEHDIKKIPVKVYRLRPFACSENSTNPREELGIPNHLKLYFGLRLHAELRFTCHCGHGSVKPIDQTCKTSSCPCFKVGKQCWGCHCRGCNNHRKWKALRFNVRRWGSTLVYKIIEPNGVTPPPPEVKHVKHLKSSTNHKDLQDPPDVARSTEISITKDGEATEVQTSLDIEIPGLGEVVQYRTISDFSGIPGEVEKLQTADHQGIVGPSG